MVRRLESLPLVIRIRTPEMTSEMEMRDMFTEVVLRPAK